MSDDLIIQLNNLSTVTITQNCSFEDFIAQFQASCSKLLCIINGKQLRYYDKKLELPMGLKFEYKHKYKDRTAYYFRDATNNTYCVFGREAAQQFYPRLDEVDPLTSVTSVTSLLSLPSVPSARNKRDYKVKKVDKLEKFDKLEGIKSIITPIIPNKIKGNIVTTRIVKAKYPSEVIIVDHGQRHSFPHANFNVETCDHKVC
jgi:hypothetical protein